MSSSEVKYDDLPNLPEHSWIVKVCEDYYDEYKECRSIKGKFHQYFVYGNTKDCTEWKQNYDACIKFRKYKDTEAIMSIIQNEKERKRIRLEAHYANDIWERRTSPPLDWNKELPANFKSEEPEGFLANKMKEMKEKNISYLEENNNPKSSCSIS